MGKVEDVEVVSMWGGRTEGINQVIDAAPLAMAGGRIQACESRHAKTLHCGSQKVVALKCHLSLATEMKEKTKEGKVEPLK